MPDQILIGKGQFKGQNTYLEAFNIDNNAFPILFNSYAWRGKVKRKRGTKYLGQLTIQVQSVAANPLPWQDGPIPLFANAFGNLTGFIGVSPNAMHISGITNATNAVVTVMGSTFTMGQVVFISFVLGMTQIDNQYYTIISTGVNTITLNVDSTTFGVYTPGTGLANLANGPTIVPGSINLMSGGFTYTEPLPPDGTLLKNGVADGSIINYSTGLIALSAGPGATATGTFSYYPSLPVMGLEDFSSSAGTAQYPILLAFDTTYSYQCNQVSGNATFYNVTYYKDSNNPFTWSGQNFQQFWSTNYPSTTLNFSGSFWATNNKPGFHYLVGTYVSGSPGTTITFNFTQNSVPYTTLVEGSSTTGDVLWFNEWTSPSTINQVTGYVSTNSGVGNYVVTFASSVTVTGTGIAQTLTNSTLDVNGNPQDGIRWYDGDPTNGTGLPTGTGFGWVNFAPPLTALTVSIDGTPPRLYYLVGALAILPFKDRLLFFSPYIQASTLEGSAPIIQLQDTVLWSWNGTPYYTVDSMGNAFLVPMNQSANPKAYYVDQTGLGNYLPAGITNPIITVSNNEDALLIGFGGDGRKTRFVYTGNDLQPFLFFNINSELPSSATFSAIPLDKGVIDIGQYGIAMTDQQSSQRVDLDIPDSVFQIQALNNGVQRVNAIRNFFREWIYFSYPVNISNTGSGASQPVFPTQTFMFNYRDNTWAILYENYTHHGYYRSKTKKSWLTLGVGSWNSWREPWNSGVTSALQTEVIAGNPQGYVLILDQEIGEAQSGTISAIQINGGDTQITSYNHCVGSNNNNTDSGDFLYFTGALGISPWNGLIGKVLSVIDANNFVVDIPFPTGIYSGLGQFTRLSQPLIQTKAFNPYWDQGRKVILCAQKYLLDRTNSSQVTIDIYLSQDQETPYNDPDFNSLPNGLVYSQIVYTCPESTNLGLTPGSPNMANPANTNLQMQLPIGAPQRQIWHRNNTALFGDSFQVGITLSEDQMKNLQYATDEIVLHGIQFNIETGSLLA